MDFLFYLESIRTPFFTELFRLLTVFGEEVFVLFLLCFFYWCFDKRLAYRLCFSYFVSGLCIQMLKVTFRVPRPWIKSPDFHPEESALKTATGYSFPSGHTQGATAAFTTVASYIKNKFITLFSIFLICSVALSRMYLGVHTPQDVICSFIITFILTLGVGAVYDRINFTAANKKFILAGMIFVSLSAVFYSLYLINQGIVPLDRGADCYKAGAAGIGFAIGWYIETTYINFNEKQTSVLKGAARLFLGALAAIIIKLGWKTIFGASIPSDMIRYFTLVLWLTVFYPFIIKKSAILS